MEQTICVTLLSSRLVGSQETLLAEFLPYVETVQIDKTPDGLPDIRDAGSEVAIDHKPNYNCGNLRLKEIAMSTVSVRIDEGLVSAARSAAKAEFRTVQGQVEFWAKVGRAALDNPDLPASFIAESLMSMAEPREDSTPFVPRSAARE